MRNHIFATVLCGAVLAPGIIFAAGQGEEQRIRDLDKEWFAAAASKDAAKTAVFYAEDGAPQYAHAGRPG